ncbi:hypothetical protein FF2_041506 [Malus domestica]
MHFSSYLRNTTVDKDFVSCEVESSTMEVEDFSLVGNGNRKIFEKALQIRMLKQILLGFKIVSFWEALITILYLVNQVKVLNKEKVPFTL